MKSSPVFTNLDSTLVELERAIGKFLHEVAPLSESLSFVGLEANLLSIQSAIAKALSANRDVQSSIVEQVHSEITSDYFSKRLIRRGSFRLVSDGS